MKVTFQGREWDTKKKYYAAGHEVFGVWQPYEDAEELAESTASSARECRIVRFFIDMESGEIESILLRVVEDTGYHIVRVGWVPDEFVDTTDKKVMANIKRLRPKQPVKQAKTAQKKAEEADTKPAAKSSAKPAEKPAAKPRAKKADTAGTAGTAKKTTPATKSSSTKATASKASAKTASKSPAQKTAPKKTRSTTSRKGATNAKK